MKKNNWKYFIDTLLFVDFCSVMVVGLLMAFIIPGGSGETSRYFLGLHRHEWGNVHLFLAISLIGLLVIHVWLNWPWILHAVKTGFGDNWQKFLIILAGAWIAVLIAGWLFALVN